MSLQLDLRGAFEPLRPNQENKDLPVGNKTTEIGTIPEDWYVSSIRELFHFLRTASNSRDDLNSSGLIRYVHYGDLHTRFKHFIDFVSDDIPTLSASLEVSATQLRDGDLIVADASEDEEGVGTSVEVRNLGSIRAVSGLHTILLRARDHRVTPGYRAYILENVLLRKQIRRVTTGLKVFGITKFALGNLLVPLPTLSEQHAIAEALSDADGLLSSLEALIAKKRAIKHAAMQQLLTGKTRLPEYSGKWLATALGEIADIKNGATPSTQVTAYWNGTIPWCTPTDITSTPGKYLLANETKNHFRRSSQLRSKCASCRNTPLVQPRQLLERSEYPLRKFVQIRDSSPSSAKVAYPTNFSTTYS